MHSPFRFLPDVFLKRRPIHLAFFVTSRCNARCPFCFYLERKDRADEGPELGIEEVRKVSASIGNLLWLAFSGGEVFLREDIVELSRIFYENNRPSVILLPTNGLMPSLIRERTEEVLKACPRSVVAVKLSIDGAEEMHDSLRGVRGAFRKVIDTYECLAPLLESHRNFELGVNTVFCASNQDDMGEITTLVKGLKKIGTHTISLVRGDLSHDSQKKVDPGKYLKAIETLEQGLKSGASPVYNFRGARLKAAQDIIQRRLIHRTITEDRRTLPCYAGRLNLVITEDGSLYPCENFKPDFKLGNLRHFNHDVKRLLADNRARKVIESIAQACYCTHECYMMTNILFNPRTYPSLLREYARIGG